MKALFFLVSFCLVSISLFQNMFDTGSLVTDPFYNHDWYLFVKVKLLKQGRFWSDSKKTLIADINNYNEIEIQAVALVPNCQVMRLKDLLPDSYWYFPMKRDLCFICSSIRDDPNCFQKHRINTYKQLQQNPCF